MFGLKLAPLLKMYKLPRAAGAIAVEHHKMEKFPKNILLNAKSI